MGLGGPTHGKWGCHPPHNHTGSHARSAAHQVQPHVGMRPLVALLILVSCVGEDDKPPGEWTPGKGDGTYDLIEAGPAPIGTKTDIALDHRVPAYRVESFGKTKLSIALAG